LIAAAALVLLVAPPSSQGFWGDDGKADLSFHGVFPQALHKKSYFGWVILGTSIVAGAAISYATAGAGAPAAATGVSTVASAVAGGGAGSYMAGLSMIGGWVGGNAMVGAAILNGISFGLGGGSAAYAGLSTIGKVGVLSSVTATALDGVLVYRPQAATALSYRIRLAVPNNIGSEDVEKLAEAFNENDENILKAGAKKDKDEWAVANDARKELVAKALSKGEDARRIGASPEDLLVLGLLNKNAGNAKLGDALIAKIPQADLSGAGYLDYLKAVIEVEHGRLSMAKALLRQARRSDQYAIEPALLLINILGHQDFQKNKFEIIGIVEKTKDTFDNDKYQTGYGMLAINYRVASMYFNAKKYQEAQWWYEAAYKSIPFTQKHFGDQRVRNLVRLGIANSLHGQGKIAEANQVMNETLNDADDYDEKQSLLVQYAGNA
jgi:hypothetical protein